MKRGNETWLEIEEREWRYHLEQFARPYRSTLAFVDFMKRNLGLDADSEFAILDVGTGAGANLKWMAREFPKCRFTGIDLSEPLIAEGRRRLVGVPAIRLLQSDFTQDGLPDEHDIVVSLQLLSWLEESDAFALLDMMIRSARNAVALSSLFNEADADYLTTVVDYEADKEVCHNVYSLPHLRRHVESNGGRVTAAETFETDVPVLGTISPRGYRTEVTMDGRVLEFAGNLFMPWWFLAVVRQSAG